MEPFFAGTSMGSRGGLPTTAAGDTREGHVASRDQTRSPDLQKLEEKLRKDPNSKLFFPLAEEYIEAGRLQEAITLLRTGIKAHPDFLSARVALGKALLSKGQVEEAKQEFEQVVTANPDNLMAHKKLAGIYFKAGDARKALASCEVILAVNPTDAEAVRLRDQIGTLREVPPEEETTVQMHVSAGAQPEAEPTVVDRIPSRDESVEPTVTMVQPTDLEPTVVGPTLVEPIAAREAVRSPTEADIAEATEVVRLPLGERETEVLAAAEGLAPTGANANGGTDEELATISLADLYVAQGHYHRGIAIYRRLLERAPHDGELTAKLDNALTLERLLAPQAVDSEAVKSEVVHQVLTGTGPVESEPDSGVLQPSLAGAAPGASSHYAAIQRLEAWLTRIAERRRR
jgi:tetratricopeptide (TPR) repeat protein